MNFHRGSWPHQLGFRPVQHHSDARLCHDLARKRGQRALMGAARFGRLRSSFGLQFGHSLSRYATARLAGVSWKRCLTMYRSHCFLIHSSCSSLALPDYTLVMPIPRLRVADTALIVIDVQEKLVPAIPDREKLVNNCVVMIRMACELGIPHLVTEHYPAGLGRTVEEMTAAMINPAGRIEKTQFSAVVDLVEDHLRAWRRPSVLVCGIEAHVCVLQTVLDLQAAGRQAFVVSDAISAMQSDQVAHALRRMETAGAVTTGVMSSMYELLGDSKHPSRQACVDLAKQIWF